MVQLRKVNFHVYIANGKLKGISSNSRRGISMKQLLSNNIYVFYSLTLALYIVNTFLNIPLLTYAVGMLAIPMLFFSFFGAGKLFRILGIIFLGFGSGFFIYSGLPLSQLPLHMTSTMMLLAFLSVLPWMNSVVRAGRFDRRINDLMKANVSDLGKLYVRSSFTTYILCMFINLTSLLVSQEVLLENLAKLKKKMRDTFINQTTLRGFALALVWSPMEVIVAMTVDGTGVSYLSYLPWLILISVFVLCVDIWRGKMRFRTIPYTPVSKKRVRNLNQKQITIQIFKLLLALTIFLVLVIVIGNYFNLNFMLSVTLVIIPYAFIWSLIMKRTRSFMAIGWKTWKVRTNNMQNFVVLFISLAFFSTSLNETPFLAVIQQPFFASAQSPLLILFLIQITFLVLGVFGVHPLATIGVLTEALQPLFTVINPLSIGIVLITGGLATAMAGAYNVTVMLTSINTEQNPYRIMLQNLPYALFFGCVGTGLAYLLL